MKFLKLRYLTPAHNERTGRTVTKASFVAVERNEDGSPKRAVNPSSGRMEDTISSPALVGVAFFDNVEFGAPVSLRAPILGDLIAHCGRAQKSLQDREIMIADGTRTEPKVLPDGAMSECLRISAGVYVEVDDLMPVIDTATGKQKVGANGAPLWDVPLAAATIHVHLGSNGGAAVSARVTKQAPAPVAVPTADEVAA